MGAKKGEYGYISSRKKRIVISMIVLVCLAIVVFVIGLVLNDMSKQNIFTVFSVLFVLPFAKQLVAFIVLFPYHSAPMETYEAVTKKAGDTMEVFSDLVITSTEHIMHLDFVLVGQNQVIGILGDGKQDLKVVRSYLQKGVHNWGSGYKVKIVDNQKIFFDEIVNVKQEEVNPEVEENVKTYLYSLIV